MKYAEIVTMNMFIILTIKYHNEILRRFQYRIKFIYDPWIAR